MTEQGAYSPDASHLAYVPFTHFADTASPIWIANLADSAIVDEKFASVR
jgi:hypothetical protein